MKNRKKKKNHGPKDTTSGNNLKKKGARIIKMYKPLPKELRLGFSDIHDIGVFAKEFIPRATNFGMTHLQFGEHLIRTPLGGFINHKDNPNCEKVKLYFTNEDQKPSYNFTKWNLITIKDIKEGEELTLKYTFYKI